MTAPALKNLEVVEEYFIRGATWADSIVLVANAAQTYTVPTNAKYIAFECSGGNDFYANFRSVTAVVPSATTTDGSAPTMNPTQRIVGSGDTISLVSAANCTVVIEAWGA